MSASEKLRALDGTGWTIEDTGTLRRALPLIADVVEAAERDVETWRGERRVHPQAIVATFSALTALREHLEGQSNQDTNRDESNPAKSPCPKCGSGPCVGGSTTGEGPCPYFPASMHPDEADGLEPSETVANPASDYEQASTDTFGADSSPAINPDVSERGAGLTPQTSFASPGQTGTTAVAGDAEQSSRSETSDPATMRDVQKGTNDA